MAAPYSGTPAAPRPGSRSESRARPGGSPLRLPAARSGGPRAPLVARPRDPTSARCDARICATGEGGSAAGDPRGRLGAARADPSRGVRGPRRRGGLRRPDQGLGQAAQRADHRRLPLRHPRGPAPPRTRPASTSTTAAAGSSAGTCRPGTSSCPTWSRPGPSGRRTSTGCCPRCWPASCGTTRSRATCSTAPLAELGLPVPVTVGAAAAGGPVVRRRVVRARRRAQAVPGRRGQRADRHRSASRAGPPVVAAAQVSSSAGRTGGPRRRRGPAEPSTGGRRRATAQHQRRATRLARSGRRPAPAAPGRAGRGPGREAVASAPRARRPGTRRPVPRPVPHRRGRRPVAGGPRPRPAADAEALREVEQA